MQWILHGHMKDLVYATDLKLHMDPLIREKNLHCLFWKEKNFPHKEDIFRPVWDIATWIELMLVSMNGGR